MAEPFNTSPRVEPRDGKPKAWERPYDPSGPVRRLGRRILEKYHKDGLLRGIGGMAVEALAERVTKPFVRAGRTLVTASPLAAVPGVHLLDPKRRGVVHPNAPTDAPGKNGKYPGMDATRAAIAQLAASQPRPSTARSDMAEAAARREDGRHAALVGGLGQVVESTRSTREGLDSLGGRLDALETRLSTIGDNVRAAADSAAAAAQSAAAAARARAPGMSSRVAPAPSTGATPGGAPVHKDIIDAEVVSETEPLTVGPLEEDRTTTAERFVPSPEQSQQAGRHRAPD